MARYSRRYVFDKTLGRVVPLDQSPEDAAVCEAITASTNPHKRDLFSEDSVPGNRTRKHIARWPIVSTAAGINPEDVPTEQAYLAERGVKTEYTPDGDPVFRDRAHRREHLRAVGMYDRDGGYSD